MFSVNSVFEDKFNYSIFFFHSWKTIFLTRIVSFISHLILFCLIYCFKYFNIHWPMSPVIKRDSLCVCTGNLSRRIFYFSVIFVLAKSRHIFIRLSHRSCFNEQSWASEKPLNPIQWDLMSSNVLSESAALLSPFGTLVSI